MPIRGRSGTSEHTSNPQVEELTLEAAIAKALRNNPAIVGRRLDQELNEMSYQSAWETMFLPTIAGAQTTSYYTVGQLNRSPVTMQSPPDSNVGRGSMQRYPPEHKRLWLLDNTHSLTLERPR